MAPDMSLREILDAYVRFPPFRIARMNRIGRAPREDADSVRFISLLEEECFRTGMTSEEFRRRFFLATGAYPEYSLTGLSLAQTLSLCQKMDKMPSEIFNIIAQEKR